MMKKEGEMEGLVRKRDVFKVFKTFGIAKAVRILVTRQKVALAILVS